MVIPEGVIQIGSSVFQDCSNLSSITIPESVDDMGTDIFEGCNQVVVRVKAESYAQYHIAYTGIEYETY